MRIEANSRFVRMAIAGGILAAALAGCSTMQSWTGSGASSFPPPGAAMANGKPTGPPPKVQDCAMINSGSPTKYVCNGKTYTTFDLKKMRDDYAAQQQSGN